MKEAVAQVTPQPPAQEGWLPMRSQCIIPNCSSPHLARGWCSKHYQRWQDHGDPLGLSDAERFWSKVQFTDSCWLWTAGPTRDYGQFSLEDQHFIGAHRWAYEFCVGPIPEGLTIDHLCRTPRCVRPDHLEPVTQQTNTLRGVSVVAKNAAKTHCIHGHPFDNENTCLVTAGRQCRTCNRDRMRLQRSRPPKIRG